MNEPDWGVLNLSPYHSRYTILVYPEGGENCGVHFPGVNWGNGSQPLLIVQQGPETITIKIPGGKVWDGTHQPWVYHAAEYHLFGIVGQWVSREEPLEISLKTVEMAHWPVRSVPQAFRVRVARD